IQPKGKVRQKLQHGEQGQQRAVEQYRHAEASQAARRSQVIADGDEEQKDRQDLEKRLAGTAGVETERRAGWSKRLRACLSKGQDFWLRGKKLLDHADGSGRQPAEHAGP